MAYFIQPTALYAVSEPNSAAVSQPALSPSKPALRLVSTKDLSRDEWLEVRKQGIGASDAATAVGLNPYQSALELWMNKTGRDEHLPKVDPNDMDSPMYWGTLLEPMVAHAYSIKTGNKVRKVNAVLQHPDVDKHWMLANLDYSVVGNDEVQILECKTAGKYGAKLWENGVPEYYQLQVQHQMAVTGKQCADIAVLICGQEFRIYRIHRDDELIEQLIELEREFWHFVETDTPPPADGSDSADKALRLLYPADNGITLDLSADEDSNQAFTELIRIREEASRLTEQESLLKQQLQTRMGDASKAKLTVGSISWKKSKDSVVLDTQALLKAQPALMQQFPLVRPGSRRFLIHSNSLDG